MINTRVLYNEFIAENKQFNLDYKTFKDIISRFNKKVISKIIEENGILNMDYKLGSIFVEMFERKIRESKEGEVYTNINWGASNKKKAEIIARGGTPYEVLERDDNYNIIKDNGGEKWQIYHTDPYCYRFIWTQYKTQFNDTVKYPLRKIRAYIFKVTKDNITLLGKHKEKKSKETLLTSDIDDL